MKEKQRRGEIEKNKLRHKARGLSEGKQIEEEIQESVPCKNLQTKPSMPFTLSLFSFSSISFPTLHVNHMYSLNKIFLSEFRQKNFKTKQKKKQKNKKQKTVFMYGKFRICLVKNTTHTDKNQENRKSASSPSALLLHFSVIPIGIYGASGEQREIPIPLFALFLLLLLSLFSLFLSTHIKINK